MSFEQRAKGRGRGLEEKGQRQKGQQRQSPERGSFVLEGPEARVAGAEMRAGREAGQVKQGLCKGFRFAFGAMEGCEQGSGL